MKTNDQMLPIFRNEGDAAVEEEKSRLQFTANLRRLVQSISAINSDVTLSETVTMKDKINFVEYLNKFACCGFPFRGANYT